MKKFLKIAFVAIFVAVAGYGVYTSQKADAMSDLMLANVEALADDSESGTGCGATIPCGTGSVSCKGTDYCISYATYVECHDKSGAVSRGYCGT